MTRASTATPPRATPGPKTKLSNWPTRGQTQATRAIWTLASTATPRRATVGLQVEYPVRERSDSSEHSDPRQYTTYSSSTWRTGCRWGARRGTSSHSDPTEGNAGAANERLREDRLEQLERQGLERTQRPHGGQRRLRASNRSTKGQNSSEHSYPSEGNAGAARRVTGPRRDRLERPQRTHRGYAGAASRGTGPRKDRLERPKR